MKRKSRRRSPTPFEESRSNIDRTVQFWTHLKAKNLIITMARFMLTKSLSKVGLVGIVLEGEGMYATKQDLKDVFESLSLKMDSQYEKFAQMLAKHFYTKDELNRKFAGVNNRFDGIDTRLDRIDGRLEGHNDKFKRLEIQFENYRTTDFKLLAEVVDGINQKLEEVIKEPKATKLQKDVDALRGRVIRLEKR